MLETTQRTRDVKITTYHTKATPRRRFDVIITLFPHNVSAGDSYRYPVHSYNFSVWNNPNLHNVFVLKSLAQSLLKWPPFNSKPTYCLCIDKSDLKVLFKWSPCVHLQVDIKTGELSRCVSLVLFWRFLQPWFLVSRLDSMVPARSECGFKDFIYKLIIPDGSLGTRNMKLLSSECHRISLMRSQYWFR